MVNLNNNFKAALTGLGISTIGLITVGVLSHTDGNVGIAADNILKSIADIRGFLDEGGNIQPEFKYKFFSGVPLLGAIIGSGVHALYSISREKLNNLWNKSNDKEKEILLKSDKDKNIIKEINNGNNKEKLYFSISNGTIKRLTKRAYNKLLSEITSGSNIEFLRIIENKETGINIIHHDLKNETVSKNDLITGLNKIRENFKINTEENINNIVKI